MTAPRTPRGKDATAEETIGVRRAIIMSESPLMRAGLRWLMHDRGVQVVAGLDRWEGLIVRARATAVQLVVAAPVASATEALFRALDDLPPGCAAVVLLAVPGFRIQARAVMSRYEVVCLPLDVGRDELHSGMRRALQGNGSNLSLEELTTGPHGTLTAREQEVLRELAHGKSNHAIAETLWVSNDTVKSHLRRIYRKLGVTTRSEAVALYIGQLGRP
jgi:DNA-binding NarL/FixJ family response regulator